MKIITDSFCTIISDIGTVSMGTKYLHGWHVIPSELTSGNFYASKICYLFFFFLRLFHTELDLALF